MHSFRFGLACSFVLAMIASSNAQTMDTEYNLLSGLFQSCLSQRSRRRLKSIWDIHLPPALRVESSEFLFLRIHIGLNLSRWETKAYSVKQIWTHLTRQASFNFDSLVPGQVGGQYVESFAESQFAEDWKMRAWQKLPIFFLRMCRTS